MPGFQTFLKSLFAICAIVSEYTLLLDRWILTAPGGPVIERQKLPPSEIRRKRLLSAARTSLVYALCEPIWCWLIIALPMHPPHNVIFCFLFGGFMHFVTVRAAEHVRLDSLDKVRKEHEEQCEGVVAGEVDEARSSADVVPNDDGEKDDEKLLESTTASPASFSSSVENNPPNVARPTKPCNSHKLDRAYHLAIYPPVATAALTNAGLILYTRYLTTPDSQTWLDKFAFGWTVVALMGIFILTVAKMSNQMMHQNCFRPFLPACTAWDAMQILSCLAGVLIVRAMLRALLSQSPFTPMSWSETQSAFVVKGLPMPKGETMNEDGTPWKPDPVWHWLGLAGSTMNIVGWGGYWGWKLYNRSRGSRRGSAGG